MTAPGARRHEPAGRTRVRDLRLLAVDVETTGLDPVRDRLLAVGVVPVDGLRIDLGGARRLVVRHEGPLGEAVTLHGLTHDVLAAGRPLPDVLAEVFAALDGRVLLAHHAPLEEGFLSTAAREVWGEAPDLHAVDTAALQRRLVTSSWQTEPPPGALRLWRARRRHGLPEVPSHDALSDALACAELYLAQVAELGQERQLTLDDLRGRRPWWRRLRRR